MRVPITVPECPPRIATLRLGEWSVAPGDTVAEGESLTELICPGLTIDLAAPAAGTVAELLRQPEQLVRSGEILGWLETE